MSLFLQSTRVDWLAVEILRRQKDFAQILQLVMWIRTMLFAVGADKLTSPPTHPISRMDTSKDKKIDRILLYRVPAEGITEEGIAGGEILASRVPVNGTKDAERGLWLRLKSTSKPFKFSLSQILPTVFTLRDDESKIIVVMSSNVGDLLYRSLPEGAEAMSSVLQPFWVGKEEHGTFRF